MSLAAWKTRGERTEAFLADLAAIDRGAVSGRRHRAARKGWSRQQAIDDLAQHTALSLHECTTETGRYISWPGQALSYKIGELKIRELRTQAEKALGPTFDVRRFHDAVLGNALVPLTLLEQVIDEFIATEQRR